MTGIRFHQGLTLDVRAHVKKVEGSSYLPWATALALAGDPDQEVVQHTVNGVPSLVRPLFGGGVVVVKQGEQEIFLPILDAKANPTEFKKISARDVGDTINRCRARAAATLNGVGLSLYCPLEGDGPSYVKALGVHPEMSRDDLLQVSYLEDEKIDKKTKRVISTYLGWHSVLAAATITDPAFTWQVVESEVSHPDTGEIVTLPAMRAPGVGWMVGVRATWRGRSHLEWLPIMGIMEVQTRNGKKPLEHQPLPSPTVHDWHRAVMRCFTKCTALLTGYGYAAYTKETSVPLAPEERSAEQAEDKARQELVGAIRQHLRQIGSDEATFTAWLKIDSIDAAPIEALSVGLDVLKRRVAERAEARRAQDSRPTAAAA